MSFNIAGSFTSVPIIFSSDLSSSDLLIVEKVKKLNTLKKLNSFLKGRLTNLDNHINTLIAQEILK